MESKSRGSTFFKDHVLTAKYRLIHPRAGKYRKNLHTSQSMSRDELRHLQGEKLRRLVTHAWEHSGFYRRRFTAAGIDPRDITGPEDLQALPVLTRRDIRDHFDEIAARNVPPRLTKISTTGGTTGVPVKTLLDRRVPHAALGWRMLSWWGYGPAVNMGLLWREASQSRRRILSRLNAWPSLQVRLDASAITPRTMERFIGRCERLHVPILHGYTGAVHHLADYLEMRGGDHWRPRLVWVTCAPLSGPHRRLLEKVFQAPVLDQYGSCEVYWIAAQCPWSGNDLHVFADARLLEIVDKEFMPVPTGEAGRILVTDLENLAFPIIRYAIGDRGRLLSRPCTCGMGLPLMAPVQGKTVDTIFLPDGTAITDINVVFDDFPEAVRAFQVRQDRTGNLEIRYVPGADSGITRRAVTIVARRLQDAVKGRIEITLKAVDEIPHRKGKLQYVFSEYPGSQRDLDSRPPAG